MSTLDQERQFLLDRKVEATPNTQVLSAWPRSQKNLPLVDVESDWVRFSTLNHRTRAEQQREAKRVGDPTLFTSDPLGARAQASQYRILRDQAGFDELRTDLETRGQQDPAVITADGVLINGNRRAAAIRSLHESTLEAKFAYVACIVLPADATSRELLGLETELQLARDFKQDYSWINQALLIRELLEQYDGDAKIVASLIRESVSEVELMAQKLDLVDDLTGQSAGQRVQGDFEENESAFTELARHMSGKDETERQGVKQVYFLGTVAGVTYRQLRHLRVADASARVLDALSESRNLAALASSDATVAATRSHSGSLELIEDLLEGDSDTASEALNKILKEVLRSGNDAEASLETIDIPLAQALDEIRESINAAADDAADEAKDKDAKSAPIKRLEAARKNIDRAGEALQAARAVPDWNEEALTKEIGLTRASLERLEG